MEGITYLVMFPEKGDGSDYRELSPFKTFPGVYTPLQLGHIQLEEAPEGKPIWVKYKIIMLEDIISISGQVHRRIYVYPHTEFSARPFEAATFLRPV